MKVASKILLIITGIINTILTIVTFVFALIFAIGGATVISKIMANGGSTADGANPTMMAGALAVVMFISFAVCLIATIVAFVAASGKKGALIACIVFGFANQNIFSVLG